MDTRRAHISNLDPEGFAPSKRDLYRHQVNVYFSFHQDHQSVELELHPRHYLTRVRHASCSALLLAGCSSWHAHLSSLLITLYYSSQGLTSQKCNSQSGHEHTQSAPFVRAVRGGNLKPAQLVCGTATYAHPHSLHALSLGLANFRGSDTHGQRRNTARQSPTHCTQR